MSWRGQPALRLRLLLQFKNPRLAVLMLNDFSGPLGKRWSVQFQRFLMSDPESMRYLVEEVLVQLVGG